MKECTIPLTPVWFSPALLDEMDKVVPSHLPDHAECIAVPKGKQVIFIGFLSVSSDICECKIFPNYSDVSMQYPNITSVFVFIREPLWNAGRLLSPRGVGQSGR